MEYINSIYSLLQHRKDRTSGIPFPLSSTNHLWKKSLAYKGIIKNSFYIIQNGMKHIFFERHWQNHTCYTTFSFINDISIDPIPLNFDLSISMLFKVSMYFNDYAYVCILLPQIMILQLRKTGGIFKETEYTLTHIVYN